MLSRIVSPGKSKDQNGEVVPVRLQKEPGNPVDSNAIAFIC